MEESPITIINHIPWFLDYCEEIGLSKKTKETYKRFLSRFILWLKKENKEGLLPHDLNPSDIEAYRLYLSHLQHKKGKALKKVTQSYYLIALRALLSYFAARNILSLPINKIKLFYSAKAEKTLKFLTIKQIKALLQAPNIKNSVGLRDRAILETLISTGLKVSQLTSLNRDQLINMPREPLLWIKKYLNTRKDQDEALFINYKGPKKASRRLSQRSIESIVNKYGREINLPFSITPEALRWARAFALLNQEVKIESPHEHKTFRIKNYKIPLLLPSNSLRSGEKPCATWHIIENIINNEVLWLKNSIPIMPEGYKENPPFLKCDGCILRKIAILIVSRKVRAVEFQIKKDLWNNHGENSNFNTMSRHGREWHRKMMDIVSKYFKEQNCEVVVEPSLNYGRADLGIYLKPKNRIFYIEIGTISLFKLWYNLSLMKNVAFLIVPSENRIIEFNA